MAYLLNNARLFPATKIVFNMCPLIEAACYSSNSGLAKNTLITQMNS